MKIKTNTGEKDYDADKVKKDFLKAFETSGNVCPENILTDLEQQVKKSLVTLSATTEVISKEQVLDIMEDTLMANRYYTVARDFIKYRFQHVLQKDLLSSTGVVKVVNKYIDKSDWKVKENANMAFSLQGLNNSIITEVTEKYWLDVVYPDNAATSHRSGHIYIHDLGLLANYCCGWDLQDLLMRGFGGVPGKIASGPANHFSTALGQLVNFLYTLQGEIAGAVAVSSIDTYLAPFIAKDGLTYKEIKQAMQEFVYNMNVPTRVGFQCLSEDTEILTRNGWKTMGDVDVGTTIATYNMQTRGIEYLQTEAIFKREYTGEMYHITGRGTDQLVSPKHRILRRVFNTDKDVLEEVEKVYELKTPLRMVAGSKGLLGLDILSDELIQLAAWVISEGSLDRHGRGIVRISIYQSPKKFLTEIEELLQSLGLAYKKRMQSGLGDPVAVLRLDSESNKIICMLLQTDKFKGTKHMPEWIYMLNARQANLFIETYMKADGCRRRISTIDTDVKNGIVTIATLAGLATSVAHRKRAGVGISKHDIWLISILDGPIVSGKITKINYTGKIWCPTTKNNTVVARRNGKVFITGNSPFSNITLDLKVPKHMADQPIIIGGLPQKETFGEFQKEMDWFNKAFFEVMLQGDYEGRVFTFPIPTLNIDKDFDWDNPAHEILWEATAKMGIPYFANFINSDMNPEDTRSMCCRLRIDNRELRSRGGGLFGANPLTGSIGVCTLNLPMMAYEANGSVDRFYTLVSRYMDISKAALESKRKVLETLTEQGLYPYSKVYLSNVYARHKAYWANHFSTIGIIGMYESAKMLGISYELEEGQKFATNVLTFMREKILKFQKDTGNMYNLEATPAEGASYKLALKAKDAYPKIFTSGEQVPYFTNSSTLPVGYTDNLFKVLEHQNAIQPLYTGGSVTHLFLGERLSGSQAKLLVKKVLGKYHIPYISITPTFSICPKHGYLSGEHKMCPKCLSEKKALEEKIADLKAEKSAC